jgi:hypothetical protein
LRTTPPRASLVRRRLPIAALLALVAMLGLMPTLASASTRTITRPAEVVFANGQNPEKPGNCSAVAFVQWAEVPRTVSATVHYTYRGAPLSKSASAPFNDTYKLVVTYQVPGGSHWIKVGEGWGSGPSPSLCETTLATLKERYGPPARVELQVENDPRQCTAVRRTLARLTKQVGKARAEVARTEGKARERAAKRLQSLKKARARAATRVAKFC